MAKMKLTKRAVDKLTPCPPDKVCTLVFDTELPGFGVKVFPSARKVFFAEYGPKGKRRRMTLGAYGVLTPDDARELARQALASVVKGSDPLADRDQRRAMPTFSEWVDEYLAGVRHERSAPMSTCTTSRERSPQGREAGRASRGSSRTSAASRGSRCRWSAGEAAPSTASRRGKWRLSWHIWRKRAGVRSPTAPTRACGRASKPQ